MFDETTAPGEPPYDEMSLDDLRWERDTVEFMIDHGPYDEHADFRLQLAWYNAAIAWNVTRTACSDTIAALVDQPVSALKLTERARNNALNSIAAYGGDSRTATVGDLIALSADDLMCIRSVGKFTVQEIKESLAKHGLHLRGEKLKNPLPPHRAYGALLSDRLQVIEGKIDLILSKMAEH